MIFLNNHPLTDRSLETDSQRPEYNCLRSNTIRERLKTNLAVKFLVVHSCLLGLISIILIILQIISIVNKMPSYTAASGIWLVRFK